MAMNNRMMPGRMQQGAMEQRGKERPKINRDTDFALASLPE